MTLIFRSSCNVDFRLKLLLLDRDSPIIFSSVSTACFEEVLRLPRPLLTGLSADYLVGTSGRLTADRYSRVAVSLSVVCVP
jgi:hypothetical protein